MPAKFKVKPKVKKKSDNPVETTPKAKKKDPKNTMAEISFSLTKSQSVTNAGTNKKFAKLKQPKQKKSSPTVTVAKNLNFKEVRDKTIIRESFNYFVGDPEYKTDFFLRF